MIGDKIKSRRIELDYSQEYLADLLGYKSKSSIQKIENGTNDIPQSKISQFASALKTTEAYLLGIEEKPTQQAGELSDIEKKISEAIKCLDDDALDQVLDFAQYLLNKQDQE